MAYPHHPNPDGDTAVFRVDVSGTGKNIVRIRAAMDIILPKCGVAPRDLVKISYRHTPLLSGFKYDSTIDCKAPVYNGLVLQGAVLRSVAPPGFWQVELPPEKRFLDRCITVTLYYLTYIGGFKISSQKVQCGYLFIIENGWTEDWDDVGVSTISITQPVPGLTSSELRQIPNATARNQMEMVTEEDGYDVDSDGEPAAQELVLRYTWANSTPERRPTQMQLLEHTLTKPRPPGYVPKRLMIVERKPKKDDNDNENNNAA